MKYSELKALLSSHESTLPQTHLSAYITFSSFGPSETKVFNELERTYAISSDNKAFKPGMGGYSIFGSCLDGTDPCVRLDAYMQAEHGGKDGWVIEDCCLLSYLLTCTNERTIRQSKLFYSYDDAADTMLRELCELGFLEYPAVREAFSKHHYKIHDYDFAADTYSAWLNAGSTGNWDWTIQPVRIYSPTHIVIGDLSACTDEEAD